MKIDRLLAIINYLLNRDLVTARELAGRFEVSHRTIQRDMEAIESAGIPVFTVQGSAGGYGIMNSYKMDRQLLSSEDRYLMLMALEGISGSMPDASMENALEKVKSLVSGNEKDFFAKQNQKLSIDFSMLGGDPRGREVFETARKAVNQERLLRFSYTGNNYEKSERTIEPMTIAFRWRAWYLYGYCLLRNDYRLFRLNRIKNAVILEKKFTRREQQFEDFALQHMKWSGTGLQVDVVLKFRKETAFLIEGFFFNTEPRKLADGSVEVKLQMSHDESLLAFILSFGDAVEVLEPAEVREKVCLTAKKLLASYQNN